ncbi:MAG: hypothetical protein ACR2FN_10380 [Chitinophagaceae bacterium]
MKKLVIILSFFPIKSLAQIIPILMAYESKYGIHYQKHVGYIELNNEQKIEGIFQYALWEFPTYNLKSFSQDGKLLHRYKSKEVKKVVLAGGDSSLSNKDSTYFIIFDGSKYFYRQLSFDKDIQVYDWLFNVNERPGLIYNALLVKRKDQLLDFKSQEDFIQWMRKNAADKIKWHKGITVQEIIRQLNGMK